MAKLPLFLLFSGLALSPPCLGNSPATGTPGDVDQSVYFCEDIKKPFFAETGKGEFEAQRERAMPEKFGMPKPAGVKRVFILGESVAQALGQGNSVLHGQSFGAWLLRQLSGAGVLTGKVNSGLEIINCGMAGYESVRIYGLLKEVLDYSPDLLVVLSGNYEGIPYRQCPGLEFELRRREIRLLERYYSLKNDPQQAWKKTSLKMHSEMLGKMAKAAKKAGVPIVFCTLPVNVRDMPSRMSMPLEAPLFASGYKLFYDKDYQAALEKFRSGLAADPDDPFLNFYIAKTLEKLGRVGEAGAYFLRAVDFDVNMTRASVDRNALIRRVAGSESACVADLENLFYKLSPGGLPGFQEFTDGMHWRVSYNKAVWDEIFRSAAACGIKGFEKFRAADNRRWNETPREDALKRLSYAVSWLDTADRTLNAASLAELSYIRQKLPGLLEEAAVSPEALDKLIIHNFWSRGTVMRLKELFPFFLANLAETERRLGNYDAALALCERALSFKPGYGYFRLLRAQMLAGLGRREEAKKEFLESGLEREAWGLGLAYGFVMLSGNSPSAGRKSPSVEHRPPPRPSPRAGGTPAQKEGLAALMDLCFAPAGGKNMEKALQACQSVVYTVNSGTEKRRGGEFLGSDASFESYKWLKVMGRAEEARETLLWTVKNAPPSWPKLAEARKILAGTVP